MTTNFPVGSRVKIVEGPTTYAGRTGTVVGHRSGPYNSWNEVNLNDSWNEVNIDGHHTKELGFRDSELVLIPEETAAATTTTQTTYRLVWGDGDGPMRHGTDLDLLQARMSAKHGDYIEYRTVITTTTNWERI